jgi:hypothetical protein
MDIDRLRHRKALSTCRNIFLPNNYLAISFSVPINIHVYIYVPCYRQYPHVHAISKVRVFEHVLFLSNHAHRFADISIGKKLFFLNS